MTDRRGQNEKVPDRMAIGKAPPQVEHAPNRVQSAAESQPHRAESAQRPHERSDRDQRHPSHQDVRRRGDVAKTPRRQDLEEYACKRRAPLDAENGPREPRMPGTQRHETERRVAAGDEEINRRVVHDVQHLLGTWIAHGMVGRGNDVQKNRTRAEDTPRDDLPPQIGSRLHGLPDQQGNHGRTEVRPDYVDDRVGDFLAGRLWRAGCRHDAAGISNYFFAAGAGWAAGLAGAGWAAGCAAGLAAVAGAG